MSAAGVPDPEPGAVLPEAVRARVLALASERLSGLAEELVPAALRPYRRFHPRKRAQLAALPLAAALEADPAFRQLVADTVPQEVQAALRSGGPLPAAPAEELAAAAYLLRSTGWGEVVARAAAELAERERVSAGAVEVDAVQRLTEQLETVRAQGRAEAARLAGELATTQAELAALRRKVRDLGGRAAAAERALAQAPGAAPEAVVVGGSGAAPEAADPGELRRLASRLRAAEAALAERRTTSRSAARTERHGEQVRLRVLLDALTGAASGLRRELALPPLDERPADALAAAYAPDGPVVPPRQGRADDDPVLLDALLQVPAVHLLVDGYNVTKAGYGDLTLEQQRTRLVRGLTALTSRTGAEVTVVFDGAAQDGGRSTVSGRGVRVLFSPVGVIADDVLRELVDQEPVGRPLVVVSSDREVADDVRRRGATAVASRALLALLER